MIAAIDPGTTHSALVLYDPAAHAVPFATWEPNEAILERLAWIHAERLVVERMSGGSPNAGIHQHRTAEWAGRFVQRWLDREDGHSAHWLDRSAVKRHLLGRTNVKGADSAVRRALCGRWCRHCLVGKVIKAPPELSLVSGHSWQALAVAVTWVDMQAPGYAPAVPARRKRAVRRRKSA